MRHLILGLILLLGGCSHAPKRPTGLQFQAAATGNLEVLRAVSPSAINRPNDLGTTLLMVAARNANLDSIKFLLEHGADPRATDHDRQGVLHYALQSRNKPVHHELMKAGADPSATDRFGVRPVEMWADAGDNDLVLESLSNRSAWTEEKSAVDALTEVYSEKARDKGASDLKMSEAILRKLQERSAHLSD